MFNSIGQESGPGGLTARQPVSFNTNWRSFIQAQLALPHHKLVAKSAGQSGITHHTSAHYTPETSFLQADLIEVCKTLRRFEIVDQDRIFLVIGDGAIVGA